MDYDLEPAYALIRRREGFAPVAKWDYAQYSGGYGTKGQPGQHYTRDQAEADMRREVAPLNSWIDQNVKVPISDAQRAALISFGYNTGQGSLQKLQDDINTGDWGRVAARMQGWNKAGGSTLSDLVNRRAEEGRILTGQQGIQPFGSPQPLSMDAYGNMGATAGAATGGALAVDPATAAIASALPGASMASTALPGTNPGTVPGSRSSAPAGGLFGAIGVNPADIGGSGVGFTNTGLTTPLGTISVSNNPTLASQGQDAAPPMPLSPIRKPLDMRGVMALAQSPRLGLLQGTI